MSKICVLLIICVLCIKQGAAQFLYPSDEDNDNSISEKKCTEYSKPITQNLEFFPLVAGAEASSINSSKCDYDDISLIIGGTKALLGEFPFMAALGYQDADDNNKLKWFCGGTLISDEYVMTAAHCATGMRYGKIMIRLGVINIVKGDGENAPDDYEMAKWENHPDYKRPKKYNDIALVKLARPVQKFSKFLRPACLFNKANVPQQIALATGWGLTEVGGDPSESLLKVPLNLFPNSKCQSVYESSKGLSNGVVDSMLCAGDVTERRDTCQGDSGGPLLITKADNQCVFYAVGVTSFGKVCGHPDIPAIYTKVSEFVPWIERIVWA